MHKRFIFAGAAIATVAAAVAYLVLSRETGGADGDDANGKDSVAEAPGRLQADAGAKTPPALKKPAPAVRRAEKPVLFADAGDEDDDDGFTPEERELSKRIEEALDKEDLSLAVACVEQALACKNTEIRQAMVDTLSWFETDGLAELTPFLADADEDVRESAMSAWSMTLSGIEDDEMKIHITELAMGVLSDEDSLEEISGEYIGIDEKIAVESLLRIIEGGGSKAGVDKAKETYEFVTGEEFTDRAAAEKWLAEEYQPEQAAAAEPAAETEVQ